MPQHRVTLLDEAITLQDRLTVPTEREFKAGTGQMIAPCTLARTGIMEYLAGDCGSLFKDRDPKSKVKIMTTKEALFSQATLDSGRSAPITIGHPKEHVNSKNAEKYRKGSLEGLPVVSGEELQGTVILDSQDAITLVQDKADDLSIGQICDLKLADKEDDFDAYKENIRINHIAIVDKGRVSGAKINDGVTYDQEYVDGLQATIDSLTTRAKEIPELKVKLADALDQVKSAKSVALNDAVETRMELIMQARLLDKDIESRGKTEAEIRKTAVKKSYSGSKNLDEQSEAYVAVLFDRAIDDYVEDNGCSDLQAALNRDAQAPSKPLTIVRPAADARQRMIARNTKEA